MRLVWVLPSPQTTGRASNRSAATSPAPALSNERWSINGKGQIVLKLKTRWKDGASQIVKEPMEFMRRLAALAPFPRLRFTRFHGVLVPNAKSRSKAAPGDAA